MRSVTLLAFALLAGCPPDPGEPLRPEQARVCVVDEDCVADGGTTTCGALMVCVDQRCEENPSRFVPCR